jgi:peptidylprolyl isomerase
MRGSDRRVNATRVPTLFLAVLAIALPLGAAGCGGKSKSSSSASSSSTPTSTTTSSTETSTREATGSVPPAPDEKKLGKKPSISRPSGNPPSTLQKRDIVKGKGKEAKSGDQVSVQYVGISWSNGKQFDASWDRGQPFEFQLGAGMVIPGWDQGVAGMKEGGRRQLIIPPDLAYGPAGQGPIGPNETLVFDIDLLKVK